MDATTTSADRGAALASTFIRIAGASSGGESVVVREAA